MLEAVVRENFKRSSPGRAGILACVISYSKNDAVSESSEIARLAYLCQITNIGSGCARKLLKERTREGWDISMRDWAFEKVSRHKITRNYTRSIFRLNNQYRKRSCAKIINGALLGGTGY